MLSLSLRERNVKTSVVHLDGFWGLVRHFRPFVLFAAKLLGDRSNVASLMGVFQSPSRLSKTLVKLWCALDTFTMDVSFIFGVRLPLRLGYSVIVDLGWLSWLANYLRLSTMFPAPFKATSPWTDIMQRLLRSVRPSRVLFLDAKTSVLEARWRNRSNMVHVATAASFAEACDSLRTGILDLLRTNYNDVVRLNTSQRKITTQKLYEAVSNLFNNETEFKRPK